MAKIEAYNKRPEHPTHWQTKVHAGSDFFQQMIADHAGNVVVLAGDIHNGAAGVEWAKRTFRQPVVFVAGNHEPFDAEFRATAAALRAAADGSNVHVLDCGAAVIGGVRFLGCTLWTDFELNGAAERDAAIAAMRRIAPDFRVIAFGARGFIRQFIPRPYGFFDQAIVQAKFYIQGIFKGKGHPFEKTPQKKLNPLQQVTYFGILNVLLPLQIITGALMWGVQRWPSFASALGGLPVLAPFHSLVAWVFAGFIVGHVYLTTTGAEPLTAINAMMTGWEDVEVEAHEGEEIPVGEEYIDKEPGETGELDTNAPPAVAI